MDLNRREVEYCLDELRHAVGERYAIGLIIKDLKEGEATIVRGQNLKIPEKIVDVILEMLVENVVVLNGTEVLERVVTQLADTKTEH